MEEPREENVLQFLIQLAAESMPRGADHENCCPGAWDPFGTPRCIRWHGQVWGGGLSCGCLRLLRFSARASRSRAQFRDLEFQGLEMVLSRDLHTRTR